MYARYKKTQEGVSDLKSPLDPIRDVSQSSGRFPKAPLPQLSSLSDAPPLSPNLKAIPSIKHGSSSNAQLENKFGTGHFENRRGAKLAPVKLNTLKMPVSSPKTGSGISFMPKGSSISRNIKRTVPEEKSKYVLDRRSPLDLHHEDSNESFNSDDGTKYSYEQTDEDDDKSYGDPNHSDVGSHFSPSHSANESPEAFDINSLVQLGSKPPSKPETSTRKPLLHEERTPTLSLRKAVQPSVLKPLQQIPLKKNSSKVKKKIKKLSPQNSRMNLKEETDLEKKIYDINEEERLVLETLQKEWATMQENLEKEEKIKYEKLLKEISEKFEDEELLLRKENEEKLSKLKIELSTKIQEEEMAGQGNLKEHRINNELKLKEEQEGFSKKLTALAESQNAELTSMKEKAALEVEDKKRQLNEERDKAIEDVKTSHTHNLQNLKEAHAAEISLLEKAHKAKIMDLQDSNRKSGNNTGSPTLSLLSNEETKQEFEKTMLLLKEKTDEHQEMLKELEKLKTLIAEGKEVLEKLEDKTSTAQTFYEEIQDEIDKSEGDLDNLRSEKSALVTELNILKSSIKSEKTNLQNLAKKSDSPVKNKPESISKGVNTDVSSTVSTSIQTSLDIKEAFCQAKLEVSQAEAQSQTCLEKSFETSDTSCQVNINQNEFENSKSVSKSKFMDNMSVESENIDATVSKIVQNSLKEVNNKIDVRFKSIEDLIGGIRNSVDASIKRPEVSNIPSNHISSTIENIHHTENNTEPGNISNILPLKNTFPMSGAVFSKKKCNCDGESNIMQDVKNSIYRLNDILSSNYIQSVSNNEVPFVAPISNCSNSLESFYSQFRNLQDKQRILDLKYKSQSQNATQYKSLGSSGMNFTRQDQFNLNTGANNYSVNFLEDPIMRARKLVLREQARSWMQQQQILSAAESSFPPIGRNFNASLIEVSRSASSISSGFGEKSPVQYPFLKFEPTQESDYDAWMSRLKTLQEKIRSHKYV